MNEATKGDLNEKFYVIKPLNEVWTLKFLKIQYDQL